MARYSHGELVQLEQAGKNAERCVCCGAVIPEGRQVCPDCETQMTQLAEARRRPMEHHIKIQKEFADAIISGEKTFEIRINDRGYRKGDLIRFFVVDGNFRTFHSLNDKTYVITYVLSGWGLCDGYVGLAIKEKTDDRDKQ